MATACCTVCLCGCLNCCANEVASCCVGLLGREKVTKIYYIILDVLIVVPAVFLFYFLQNWQDFADYFGDWIKCPEESGGYMNCFGISAVYRLSFALLMLYLTLVIIMMCRNRLSRVVNEGLYFIKYILVVGMFIGFLYVKNDMFMQYGDACKYIGLVFLVLQSIILIDLFYLWGINWVKKYNDGESCYGTMLIVFTIILYGGALVLNIYGYIEFSSCTLWVNIVTSIILILIPLVQLLGWNEQNSLLTTSVVCLYLSYLSLISQYSKASCNALTTGPMAADLSTSTILFFLTMYGSVMGGTGVVKINEQLGVTANTAVATADEQKQGITQPLKPRLSLEVEAVEKGGVISDDLSYGGWGWVKWHIYMCIGSMYIAMMITNWGSPQSNDPIITSYQPNAFAFWSRLSLEWGTALLYIWTLVAPRIFPNRDFVIQ